MDTEIVFTPASLVAGILALCAGITCVAAAVTWIIKGINAARQPSKKIHERLSALEQKVEEHESYFDSDKKRLEEMEQGNRITQRAILALLSHGIDGNDIEAMKSAKKELQDFLIGK